MSERAPARALNADASTHTGRALVTGASRRVGRAIAIELARRGLDVTITARQRNADLLETATMAAAAHPHGTQCETVELELGDPAAVEHFVRTRTDDSWDVLVLNASSYRRSGATNAEGASGAAVEAIEAIEASASSEAARFAREAEEDFRVNAASALALAVGLAPALAQCDRAGGGAIVAMGDMHVDGRPVRGFTPYLMSKAALAQMVRSLAVELAPRVRVNAVMPGVIAWPDDTSDKTRRAYEARIPLARAGTPEDAAGAVAWLALDAPYVTGVELRLDGGRWLR